MKILIIANHSIGLYSFRSDLILELCKNNEVYLSTPNNGMFVELEQLGAKIIETKINRRGINPISDLSLIKDYYKMIKGIRPDLVITYTIKPNVYGGTLCSLMKVSYVENITGLGSAFQHDNILRKIVVLLYKLGLKKAKTVFFENSENMQIFLDEGIAKKNQVYLLNGAGVNLEKYAFKEYPEQVKTTRFLFMGRVMAEKGVNELFEAMDKLHRDGYNFELDVLGFYEENYHDIIKQYENDGWLNYHGFQEDVKPFIEKSHCFVLPSWHEGMANTNLECGAMGRPIITSNIHGCLEAVIDGETGYLAEKKNADDLYDKLKQFIELPYDKKAEMGQASHNHIAKNFDKKDVVRKTIERIFSEDME